MVEEGFNDLLRKAQAGDRPAMDRVLSILQPHLDPLARSYADPSRPAQSTSDLLQESCLRAWEKLGDFRGGENDEETFRMFRAWMGQIVRRLGLNVGRDRMAKGRSPEGHLLPLGVRSPAGSTTGDGEGGIPSPGHSPSAYVRADELTERVREALETMPDRTAAAILRLRFFEGMELTEIAERLGLHYEKVRDRHRVAMQRLRRDLRPWLKADTRG